jgi:hypothetical protein
MSKWTDRKMLTIVQKQAIFAWVSMLISFTFLHQAIFTWLRILVSVIFHPLQCTLTLKLYMPSVFFFIFFWQAKIASKELCCKFGNSYQIVKPVKEFWHLVCNVTKYFKKVPNSKYYLTIMFSFDYRRTLPTRSYWFVQTRVEEKEIVKTSSCF